MCTFTVVSNQPANELLSNVAVHHILTCRNNNALPGLELNRSSRCVCDGLNVGEQVFLTEGHTVFF